MKTKWLHLRMPIALLFTGIFATSVLSLGTEDFGHAPVNERDYQEWPNLVHVLNDTSRVYSVWVNGGESFFFRGNTESLNQGLQRFSAIQADVREVVLLPGPEVVSSLMQERRLNYDWCVKINGGISKFMTRGKGGLIWSKDPMFTVFVGGGNIDLEKIQIPKGVTVLETSDLRKRYTQAVHESEDVDVRGWGAGCLARLDPFAAESVSTVAGLLGDTNEWVQLNAAGAFAAFGKNAVSAIPSLRTTAQTSNKDLKERAEKTIAAIEAASDDPAGMEVRKSILERIHLFRSSLSEGTRKVIEQ